MQLRVAFFGCNSFRQFSHKNARCFVLFDSTLLAAVASEIRDLASPTIREIVQNDEEGRVVVLQLRDANLCIDTHPQRARLFLSSQNIASSTRIELTPFVQTLRKTLRGARLVQISQPNFDRVLRMQFQSRNELGEDISHVLIVELMERRSNLILLDENDIIVDALKRLPPFLNRARTILPNQTYELPPSNGENPLLVSNWEDRVLDAPTTSDAFVMWLREHFTGISPTVSRLIKAQLNEQSHGETARVCEDFWRRIYQIARGNFTPFLCENQPYPIACSENCQPKNGTLSALIEECASRENEAQSLQNQRAILLSHLAKREKINKAQRDDIEKSQSHAQDAERFKAIGNLMLTRIGEVENALAEKRKTLDLQGENGEVFTVELEPDWNAGDNAQRYFNRYRRALKLRGTAPERNRVLEIEQAQLESWREKSQAAQSVEELENIARDCGFSKDNAPKTVSRSKQQEESARPESKLRGREIEGWQVWMGRSALENQLLLSKVARPSDIWLHVRDVPSAHVLIKNQKGAEPPFQVVVESARWLANVSRKNQSGETLEIIYTPAKWVRAVKGSPGRVTLNRFQTLLITT